MSKIDSEKMLFSEAKRKKNFGDLIEVIEGSPNQATLGALGMEITFAWVIEKGEKKIKPIARSKEGRQSPGSMDIPKELYDALRRRAIAVTNSHAEASRSSQTKKQLENQIKRKQPDLF